MKRFFFLTEYFPPSFASTGLLLEELADSMGIEFDITVITSIKKNDFSKTEKNYKTKRLSFLRFDKNKKAGKILNGIFFFISCFFYLLFFSDKNSILLIVSNPPYLPAIGYFFYKLRKQKFVYLLHDQYPEIAVNLGYLKPKSLLVKIWKSLNNKIFSASYFTIALGEMMGKFISGIYPVINKRNNLKIISNWSDKNLIFPYEDKISVKKKYMLYDKFVIQYSGNMGLFHDLEVLIDAAEILKEKTDMIFQFIGDGGKKNILMELSRRKKLTNVVFSNFVEKNQLNDSLNCADIAVISLDKRASNLSLPSKFYGILAAGLPLVAIIEKNTDIGFEIMHNNLGYVCEFDPIEIAEKIINLYNNKELRNNFSINSRNLFFKNYDRDIIMKKYDKLFGDIQ